ncbi:hypothetical protein AB6A40_005624, partial [Gnathostoma spinigerum]
MGRMFQEERFTGFDEMDCSWAENSRTFQTKNMASTRTERQNQCQGGKKYYTTTKKVKCYLMNCRSVRKKLDFINFLATVDHIQILSLTETWANDSITDAMMSLGSKFQVFRCDRPSGISGGVAILVHNSLKACAVQSIAMDGIECCAVDIFNGRNSWRLITIYRSSHNVSFENHSEISQLISASPYPCIVTGDFNAPHIDWVNLSTGDLHCRNVYNFFTLHGLTQHVLSPTRNANILDLVLTQVGTNISDLLIHDRISDHCYISYTINVESSAKKRTEKKLNFRKGNYSYANYLLASYDWLSLFGKETDIDRCYAKFCSIVHGVMVKCIPAHYSHAKCYPSSIKKLLYEKLYIWRKYGNCPAYKVASKLCRKAINDHVLSFERSLLTSGNLRSFFSYVKSRTQSKNKIPAIFDNNGVICNDDFVKANLFNDHYESVFIHDNGLMPPFSRNVSEPCKNIDFSPYIVEKYLKKLPAKFSHSPDGLPSYFLKRCAISLALPLSHIFYLSLFTKRLPATWKTAVVVPIFKSGSRNITRNYRPISLTSNVCKVMESIIKDNIVS